MPSSEETGSGPVIHDRRRIDPVTGQVRGKHAASKPAGTTGAGRPGPAGSGSDETPSDPAEAAGSPGSPEDQDAQPSPAQQSAAQQSAAQNSTQDNQQAQEADETGDKPGEAPEMVTTQAVKDGKQAADLQAQLAERTADLQRLQAEYANYRKRVDRDRAAVKEQAVASTLAGLLPVLDAINQADEHGELTGGFKSVADSLQAALSRLGLVTYGEKGDAFDPKIHEALINSYSSDVTEDTCVEILQPGYQVGDRILRPARVAVAAPATGPDGSSNEGTRAAGEEGN
jgi:molecular chaperone GrpE